MRAQRTQLVGLALLALVVPGACAGYPRIANLWGTGPALTDYDRWARYGLLITSGGSPDQWRRCAGELRARAPDILLLTTAPLMNIGPPEATPWMRDEWYLRRPDGSKVSWWAGQVYAPNLFMDPCLDALLDQTAAPWGDLLADGTLSGVFYDSVVPGVTWYGDVDTDGDGAADGPEDVNDRWTQRQCLFFDRLKERWPRMVTVANDVGPEHAPHLNGRLLEGGPLLDRVASGAIPPQEAIATLNRWITDSQQPAATFAIMPHPLGWQGWRVGKGNAVTTPGEVDRVRRDFRRMRLGLLTTLMTDAYYAYDFGTVWYGLPYWYAEYDAPLGKPLGASREVFEVPPSQVFSWAAGEDAGPFLLDEPARVTPEGVEGDVPPPGGGWARLFRTDPQRVRLLPGKTYRIRALCEVLRKPSNTFQFDVRTYVGGWQNHDKGISHNAGEAGSVWQIEATVTPDDFEDYCVEWHVLDDGGLRLKSLQIELIGESYYRRDFEGGVALLNTTPHAITVKLDRPMRRLTDEAAPRHVLELDDGAALVTGAWERVAGERHYCGSGFRRAVKPGDCVTWSFTAPEADTYTVFAAIPGGKELTEAASYAVVRPEGGPSVTVDQRRCDGGWFELFDVRLNAGERCDVRLTGSGAGSTAADAVRLESASRYNDGGTTQGVVLPPLDGVILLNP